MIGGGHGLTELALAGGLALTALPLLFVVRYILTISSYGTGAAGGIFAPLLTMGSLLGLALGQIAPLVPVGGCEVSFFGAVFLFAVALPFLITYLRSSQNNWWAIIPTGSLTGIAVITALVTAGWIRGANGGAYANTLLIGELAATFAVVWLRHARSWARTVTIILATMAVASVLFVSYSQMIWPVTIILLGIYMFYTALRPKAV